MNWFPAMLIGYLFGKGSASTSPPPSPGLGPVGMIIVTIFVSGILAIPAVLFLTAGPAFFAVPFIVPIVIINVLTAIDVADVRRRRRRSGSTT